MHDVVEMLLTRIKDYPEDFVREPSPKNLYEESGKLGKWYAALRTAQEVMTEEEKVVINDALEMAKRAVYMGAALKTIMRDEPEELGVANTNAIKTMGYGLSQAQILPTARSSSRTLITETEERIRAQEYEAQRREMMNSYKVAMPLSAQIASNLDATGLYK